MNKRLVLIVAVVAILLGVGGVILVSSRDNGGSTSKKPVIQALKQATDACSVFTLDDARKVLGNNAEKPGDSTAPPASSDDINVSQCMYQTPIKTLDDIKTQKQANLLARAAKSDTGKKSNQDVFSGLNKPSGVQDVSGYGEAAFWNPQYGQLNILRSGNWYILSVGESTPSLRTLDEAKKFADTIVSKL